VVASPHVSQIPCDEEMILNTKEILELFSACAVTWALSRATSKQPIADASISERETTSQVVDDHNDSSSSLLSQETNKRERRGLVS